MHGSSDETDSREPGYKTRKGLSKLFNATLRKGIQLSSYQVLFQAMGFGEVGHQGNRFTC